MAINEEEIILNVEDGTPYFIGSRAYVTQNENGATITIIDREGTTSATINNGADGEAGADGADGFSPIATVTKIGDTATISITDANGLTTASISDGDINVQSDWNEADGTADDFIKNKPSIPTTAADVGAVPTTRTVNSKALSSDITLSASDVGAVPTTRTVNSKALSSNITLAASDVGAVPTTRTVNSKALSSNITLSASDVGAPTTSDFSSLTSRVGTAEGDITTLDARMDSFTNLAEGSTTGDAELIDGRTGADGVTYTNIGGAIRGQVSDLKSALNVVESTFDERVQYLIADKWISGEYYGAGSTNIGYNANYRRYASFKLKAGKYYYYHIHPLFTNIVSTNISITNLTNYSGTTQVVNNDTGYFTIPEEVTIYITSHFASGSMLSLYEQNVNNYVEGIYYIKPKYEGLLASNVAVENIHLTDILNISTSTYVVYSGGKIHQTSPSSGNAGWKVPVDVSKLKNNMVELVMDIESVTGTGRLYLIGKDTSNQNIFAKVRDITTAGKQTDMFDLNYYVVYNNLDLTKTIEIAVYNQTNNFDCYYTAIDTYTITTELDTEKNLNDNLNDMVLNIEKNSNAINSIQSTSKMVSPNGTVFALQVSDNGEISAVRVLPTKTLFIGNSLLVGNGTFGMCATDNQHDYYHYVTNEITSKNADATFDKIKGTEFEAATDAATANAWMSGTLLSHLPSDLDLAIVQLGDNVNTSEKTSAFAANCGNLIRYIKTQCPNARVAWVGEWYSTAQKQAIISNSCASTASTFVDISDLVTSDNKASIGDVIHKTSSSTTTYAIDSYTDDAINKVLTITFTVNGTQYASELPYTSYTTGTGTITVTGYYTLVNNTAVASHPSNKGMLAIANRICYTLGITNSEDEIVA